MHPESKYKVFLKYFAVFVAVLILSISSIILSSVTVIAEEIEIEQTVSGQEVPDESQEQNQEGSKDDQNSDAGDSQIHNPEANPAPGTIDNFNSEEREMIADILVRLDRLIELLTPEEPEPVILSPKEIIYPDGYQSWPYPVRVHYSMLTYDGYTTEWATDCESPEVFEESFRSKVQNIEDGSLQTFMIRYVLCLDENSMEGGLVYDYANPVYLAAEALEEDEGESESVNDEMLLHLESIDEKLSDMQTENHQQTISGNGLLSQLDDTIQKGNEENRRMITDLFTQGTTYVLVFIGIVVGAILGLILSRYLKHD